MKKSLIALLLAVAMLLSVVPAMADMSAALPYEGEPFEYHCFGADLITEETETQVYQEYLKTKDPYLLKLLLLHNEDDLKGMPKLLPILHYPDFFDQDFSLLELKRVSGESPRVLLTLCCEASTSLPVSIGASVPSYTLKADKNRLTLSVRLYEGTLKYFYPNYKDYYYLIYEDTAIHKSVGEYVDRDAKVKATKETCYTKKSGTFLPQPEAFWTPDFKNSCKDKTCFFEFCPDCFSDHETLNQYIRRLLKDIFTAR